MVLLQIRDNQQIINNDENIDDSLGKPRDNIVVINDDDDDGLTTRQGATFDDCLTPLTLRSTERKPHVKRPSDRRYYTINVSIQ